MKQKDWNDITLKQLYDLESIIEHQDDYTFVNELGIVYNDVDFENMPLSDFSKYKGALEFISKDIPRVKLKKHYTLNGTVYDSNFDLTQVNVAQFIDYQNYAKKENPKYEELLSVFIIPEGHKYNDGYDLKKAQEDILQLPMPVIKTATFFFEILWQEFLILFQQYLQKDIQKMDLQDSLEKKIVLDLLEKINTLNLA